MKSLRAASFAALALALMSASARADAPGDAWSVAKGMLPANTQILIGLNIATIKGSALFQQLYPAMMAQAGNAKDELEKLKATCGLELKETVQGVVVALDETQKGVVYLSLKGVDQPKLLDCMNKMGAKEKEKKSFTATKADPQGIVEYSESGSKEKVYIAWLPKGVVALSTEQGDKTLLQKWLGGKGIDAKNAAAAIGKVNTGAAVWGMVAKEQKLEDVGTMKVGYGHADIAGGNISCDVRVVLSNPKEANDAAAKSNKQLEDAKKSGSLPPALASVLKSVKIAAAGEELQVKASMPEKEALGLIGMAMGGGQQH